MPEVTDELRYKLLKALEQNPNASQRELAQVLGISLGKTNFCLQALLEVGWLKAKNFKNSKNKLAYMYLLTPKGVDEKVKITQRFLAKKLQEHEALKQEIAEARDELKRVVTK